jgi:AraC-like DNA-binding protein
VIKYHFQKFKYGKELLVDCPDIKELLQCSMALKEFHATSFYEMFFLTSGHGKIIMEDNSFEFSTPVVLLLPPAHPRVWKLESPIEGKMIIFEEEFIETFLKDQQILQRLHYFGNYEAPPALPLDVENMDYYIDFLKEIEVEIESLQSDSLHLLRAYLYQLLILVNRHYTRHFNLKENLYYNNQLLKFKDLLRKNIREKQTVKEYAELLGINRNKINHLCQETFGKIAQDIIRLTLLHSCKFDLLDNNLTIAEISIRHNFSAPSNFVRFFKSLTNLSPAIYRADYCNFKEQ